jgi:hypothetical protein
VRGKWAAGIVPRNFAWVIKDQLAVCERPGGYGVNHRRVRRQEEIIWLREQGFTRIVSLLPSPHNLHAYDELSMPWKHLPLGSADDNDTGLEAVFADLHAQLQAGDKLVVHMEEVGDRLQGTMGGYLLYSGLVPEGPRAIAMIEHLLHRQMGPAGREVVTAAARLGGGS